MYGCKQRRMYCFLTLAKKKSHSSVSCCANSNHPLPNEQPRAYLLQHGHQLLLRHPRRVVQGRQVVKQACSELDVGSGEAGGAGGEGAVPADRPRGAVRVEVGRLHAVGHRPLEGEVRPEGGHERGRVMWKRWVEKWGYVGKGVGVMSLAVDGMIALYQGVLRCNVCEYNEL